MATDAANSMNVVDPGTASASSSTMHSREKTSETELAFTLRAVCISSAVDFASLEERPDGSSSITSTLCLGTLKFLCPALTVVLAEMRPTLMAQAVVRLTAISLRLRGDIPFDHREGDPSGSGAKAESRHPLST